LNCSEHDTSDGGGASVRIAARLGRTYRIAIGLKQPADQIERVELSLRVKE
jgi:hypothetical protein